MIGGRTLGPTQPPFIVAEMSGNHNGQLDRALAIVDSVAEAGAHALKLQTYTADTMTLDLAEREFLITDHGSLWKGRLLYDLYQEAHTPWEWHRPIMDRCRERGILCFSTPFDATAVDSLETLDVPCYKIASFENVDLPLIRKAAATGKPLIISTGMATLDEVEEAVRAAQEAGCKELVLLKCTSTYPGDPPDSRLLTIPDLRRRFDVPVGLSDHTPGIGVACAAVALGAVMVEKHVTLSRADGGVDSAFSLEPDELRSLVTETARAAAALGAVGYGPTEAEKKSLVFRRSLYVVKDMKAGEVFTSDNLRSIRPGLGLPPKHFESILGRRASRDIRRGTPMSWELV
jgi:pseudaminic acid synthase